MVVGDDMLLSIRTSGLPSYSIRSKAFQPNRAYIVSLWGVNKYSRSNPSFAASSTARRLNAEAMPLPRCSSGT